MPRDWDSVVWLVGYPIGFSEAPVFGDLILFSQGVLTSDTQEPDWGWNVAGCKLFYQAHKLRSRNSIIGKSLKPPDFGNTLHLLTK